MIFVIAIGWVNAYDTRIVQRIATLSLVNRTEESETTVASVLATKITCCAGMAHTTSAATAGELYSGTPEMVRDTGCVTSVPSNGLFDPAVPYSFKVLRANTVAGAATKLVTLECNTSAFAIAALNQSRFAQLPALVAVAVVNDPRPDWD